MNKNLLLLTLLIAISISCKRNADKSGDMNISASISVTNPSELPYKDALVEIDIKSLFKDSISAAADSFVLMLDTTIYPFQLNDSDKDSRADNLLFVCSLKPGEEKVFTFMKPDKYDVPVFKKRTQAEISVKAGGEWKDRKYIGGAFKNIKYLRVPPEHTDHSFYVRYEGPGWESDRVGYRFYLDWRNAIDIFGKMVDTMVLQDVGQDGFDSYHEPAPWGMDILKVGNSLGLGSIGIWHDKRANRVAVTDSVICKIVRNGPVQSMIKTKYYGWQAGDNKTDLKSLLSIHAGSRMTRHQLYLSKEVDNICTGIVKHEMAEKIMRDSIKGKWTYLATYGKQSLADDKLGMAIFYKSDDLVQLTEDEESHVVVLKPDNNKLDYYFAAAWENEKEGIKNIDQFREYLETATTLLNNPLLVK
jgi:hypothetical protein